MVSSLMEDREIISLYSNIVETFENENLIVFFKKEKCSHKTIKKSS